MKPHNQIAGAAHHRGRGIGFSQAGEKRLCSLLSLPGAPGEFVDQAVRPLIVEPRDASGGAGGGACARTEAPANSRKDRDNVATPNLTTIPFPRARRRLAVTRVTGIRAVLRHAAHGPLRARFPAIRHVETVGATQVKRSPMELCKPAISLRLDSARSRHVVRFRAGPAGGLLDAAMPSLRAVPATTSSTVSSVYRV